ncbi:MAG TPA: hypothetical protein VIN06_19605, partial [Devosia sp.]
CAAIDVSSTSVGKCGRSASKATYGRTIDLVPTRNKHLVRRATMTQREGADFYMLVDLFLYVYQYDT